MNLRPERDREALAGAARTFTKLELVRRARASIWSRLSLASNAAELALCRSRAPRYLKIGRLIPYRNADVETYLRA